MFQLPLQPQVLFPAVFAALPWWEMKALQVPLLVGHSVFQFVSQDFYNSTNGKSWAKSDNWSASCCCVTQRHNNARQAGRRPLHKRVAWDKV